MRRLFALVLIALLLGVGIVAVIETDPGYVLIAYGNYTLETSLWVGIVLLALFTLAVYLLLRLIRRLLGGQQSLASWIGGRRARAASRLTTRGMISYIEGNWSRARRQLLRGAKNSEAPLVNYLMSARASYRLNEPDKMREYLGAAEDAESEAGIAVELTQAELRLHSGKFEQALATLVRARRNAGRHPYVLDLLHRAYYGLRDWSELAALLPELRKYKVLSADALDALEREIYSEMLAASASADDGGEALRQAWQKMPPALRQDAAILHSYVALLVQGGNHAAAEKVIPRALKQSWDSRLVREFGYVRGEDSARQLAQAESWLSAHRDDPQLQLCLGRLAAREKLWGKARDYFESSYRLERSAEVCAELGRLLVALGEPKVAAAYYREGLQLKETGLPELPMPESTIPAARRLAGS
ncbi:heme biosynthesis protein HemY [Seongchinamella sediminis]|uniref:Heme biosynthesis protein HemY n=1 Tax=Seongchinamella sediminis TaxID=2283635 RepID=A0A3L7DYA6_9GAMM|nr:heme biosynthesis HemY N-terminal domain-containing protein [Seongchinamella sediminis]RLQ20981.1 heme biosynthesis protein HemY [Seongchinamella sediminis]